MGKRNNSKYDKIFKKGQRFKKWIIIGEKVEFNNKREAFILCKCKCGLEKLISCYYLNKGLSTGCFNCGHGNKGENNAKWKGYKEIPGSVISRIKSRSKRTNLKVKITGKDIYNQWIKQNKKCALSGLDIDFINTNTGNSTRKESKYDLICSASVDRIDSTKGYIKDNIQIIHKDINFMKNNYDEKYFINMCKLIAEKQP